MKVSVVGVPKTIDNDIQLMDKTFGFDTALEGPNGLLQHLEHLIKTKGKAVVCVAEGAGQVHAAFAGFSGITTGICNIHYVYLPIPEVIRSPRCVDPNSRMWHRCLTSTGQPDFH
ncbi:hypothetical protein BHM03_00038094 [Ensete ventricosum]|nr:hypothetical protein BHM03_00038094 [Ensete ventricosum]